MVTCTAESLLMLLLTMQMRQCRSSIVSDICSFGCAGASPELYCQRCPKLDSASDYTMLLVAVSDARRHRSSALQLLPVSTKDVTPPVFVSAATASNVGESNFTLTVELDEAGEPPQSPTWQLIQPCSVPMSTKVLHFSPMDNTCQTPQEKQHLPMIHLLLSPISHVDQHAEMLIKHGGNVFQNVAVIGRDYVLRRPL